MGESIEAETPTATEIPEAVPDVPEVPEPETTPAEVENTETQVHAEPGPVPYNRFKQVNQEKNALKEAMERATARIRELEAAQPAAPAAPVIVGDPEDLPDPPEHLSAAKKIAWYVEHGAKRAIERDLGMSLADAKTLLSVNRQLGKDYAERTWTNLCETVGSDLNVKLDPNDKALREEASSRTKRGYEPKEAVQLAAMKLNKKPESVVPKKTATVEAGGVVPSMTQERWLPATPAEAATAAHQGKRAPHLTAEEIFRQKAK